MNFSLWIFESNPGGLATELDLPRQYNPIHNILCRKSHISLWKIMHDIYCTVTPAVSADSQQVGAKKSTFDGTCHLVLIIHAQYFYSEKYIPKWNVMKWKFAFLKIRKFRPRKVFLPHAIFLLLLHAWKWFIVTDGGVQDEAKPRSKHAILYCDNNPFVRSCM